MLQDTLILCPTTNSLWNILIRSQPVGYREEAVVPESCTNVAKLSWKAQYPILFINSIDNFSACNRTWIDGQNSEGLSAGSLYFEQYASYAKEIPKEQCGNAISHLQMVNFLLGMSFQRLFESSFDLRS